MAAPTGNVPTPYTIPDGLKLAIALLLLGAFVEVLYRFSPTASYSFVALILLGYAAVSKDGTMRIEFVTDFFNQLKVVGL